ncbi:MAG: antibiotic biosynthesis monooxygenase [Ectothiorhodospiraceae bacterium]|nr:antibiotic biosynthesis monooxygenase [Ectothiorhodospiraceae bacterium]
MAAKPEEATSEGPVTVAVSRRIRPGMEEHYEEWVRGVTQAAQQWPGHLGVDVLRPSAATGGEYVIIYRFDTYAHSKAWEESEERARWTARLDDMIEGDEQVRRVTGLEFWFDLPEVPVHAQPSQHRMALTLIVVVFLLLLIINLILAPILDQLHWIPQLLVVVTLQVLLLTYVVMPRVTRLLKPWLFRGSPGH